MVCHLKQVCARGNNGNIVTPLSIAPCYSYCVQSKWLNHAWRMWLHSQRLNTGGTLGKYRWPYKKWKQIWSCLIHSPSTAVLNSLPSTYQLLSQQKDIFPKYCYLWSFNERFWEWILTLTIASPGTNFYLRISFKKILGTGRPPSCLISTRRGYFVSVSE